MRYPILAFSFLFILGCATPLNDTCVYTDYGKVLCQKDVKGLPADFPPELFKKWMFQKPSAAGSIEGFPVLVWRNQDGAIEAILVFEIIAKDNILAFAMIEGVRGGGKMVWISKGAKDINVILLDLWLQQQNQESQT